MKFMKKLTLIISVMMLLSSLSYASSGVNNVFQYYEPDITAEFDEGNELDEITKEKIADHLAGIITMGQIDDVTPDNILCTLFGHQTSQSAVTVTRHKVYIHAPRCRKDFYEVTSCSRCDYTVEELLGSACIDCHPEDEIN